MQAQEFMPSLFGPVLRNPFECGLHNRTKGGLNTKIHMVADERGRPVSMTVTAGQCNAIVGARRLLDGLPEAEVLIADRGCEADWLRKAAADRGMKACIPSKRNRKVQIPHDRALHRLRNMIENTFSRLRDRRRLATRHDSCPTNLLALCALAATVLFRL